MAGVASVHKSLNPEAPEFVPSRIQNTTLKLPSRAAINGSLYCSPAPSVSSFENPNYYYFHGHHYCTTPPSPYILTYTATNATTDPRPLSMYTNPNHPTHQPHDCLAGPAKGYRRRRGKRRYCYRNKSVRRRNGVHEGRRDSRAKFNKVKKDFSDYSTNELPKQRHPIVLVQEDGGDTTVMIRNIPNRFTREMVMDFLDDHCKLENQKAKQLIQDGDDAAAAAEAEPIIVSAYDFLYLPIDFKNGVNKGYAFVNFTDPKAAWKFYLSADNLSWGAFQSNKIRKIATARLQGKDELERHFESTNFPRECKHEYLPVCFSPARDGSRETVNHRTVGRCSSTRATTAA